MKINKKLVVILASSVFLICLISFPVIYFKFYIPLLDKIYDLERNLLVLDGEVKYKEYSLLFWNFRIPYSNGLFYRNVVVSFYGTIFNSLKLISLDPGLVIFGTSLLKTKSFLIALLSLILWSLFSHYGLLRLRKKLASGGRGSIAIILDLLIWRYSLVWFGFMILYNTIKRKPKERWDLRSWHAPPLFYYSLVFAFLFFSLLRGAMGVISAASATPPKQLPNLEEGMFLYAYSHSYNFNFTMDKARKLYDMHLTSFDEYHKLGDVVGIIKGAVPFLSLAYPSLSGLFWRIIGTSFLWLIFLSVLPGPGEIINLKRYRLGPRLAAFAVLIQSFRTIRLYWGLVFSNMLVGYGPDSLDLAETFVTPIWNQFRLKINWFWWLAALIMVIYVALPEGVDLAIFKRFFPLSSWLRRRLGKEDFKHIASSVSEAAVAIVLLVLMIALISGYTNFFFKPNVVTPVQEDLQAHPQRLKPLWDVIRDVNRFVYDLEGIEYSWVSTEFVNPSTDWIDSNEYLFDVMRVIDKERAYLISRKEIGQRPYVVIPDPDNPYTMREADADFIVLNIGGKEVPLWVVEVPLKYGSPVTDDFFRMRQYYTHSDVGFVTIIAGEENVTEAVQVFKEKKMYFGASRAYDEIKWVCKVKGEEISEVGNVSYDGKGIVWISAPKIYFFDHRYAGLLLDSGPRTLRKTNSVFYWRFKGYERRNLTVGLILYRSLPERFNYYLMPLDKTDYDEYPLPLNDRTVYLMWGAKFFDTRNIPFAIEWRVPDEVAPLIDYPEQKGGGRLVALALGDIYDGKVDIYMPFDDFLSKYFKAVYGDLVRREFPEELKKGGLRYPEKYFLYRQYFDWYLHVEDVSTFRSGEDFFRLHTAPEGPITELRYVIYPEGFVGIYPVGVMGAKGPNIGALYVVNNEFESFGSVKCYRFPIKDSPYLFFSPSKAKSNILSLPEIEQYIRLKNPIIGQIILYKLNGGYWMYVLPFYRVGAGGVVQIVRISVLFAHYPVGREVEFYVGWGENIEEAVLAASTRMMGIEVPPNVTEIVDIKALVEEFYKYKEQGDFVNAWKVAEEIMEILRKAEIIEIKGGG